MSKRVDDAKKLLMHVEGISDTLAQSLYQYGYGVEQVAIATVEALSQVPGFSAEKSADVIAKAKELVGSPKWVELKKKIALQEIQNAQQTSKLSTDAVFEKLKAEVKAQEEKQKEEAESKKE
jgi:ERCC4-type nuclease